MYRCLGTWIPRIPLPPPSGSPPTTGSVASSSVSPTLHWHSSGSIGTAVPYTQLLAYPDQFWEIYSKELWQWQQQSLSSSKRDGERIVTTMKRWGRWRFSEEKASEPPIEKWEEEWDWRFLSIVKCCSTTNFWMHHGNQNADRNVDFFMFWFGLNYNILHIFPEYNAS